MDEEITIIDSKTRNERIKNFFLVNKKKLSILIIVIILSLIGFYSYQIYKDSKKENLSNRYNELVIKYNKDNTKKIAQDMKFIVEKKDSTYSPLALYFLIDNNLIESRDEINVLFDILINKTSLDFEIKNLIIYKKALYNADDANENELLKILNPLIGSKSVWKSHALYLMAEYFYSQNENQKAKEFFNQLITVDNGNQDLIKKAQKRLSRDLSD